MERLFYSLLGGRLLIVLVVSYLLVAGLMALVSTLVTERVIDNYLATDEAERVAEGTRVVSGLRPEPRRGGRNPAMRRHPGGSELLALGEAFWYTEDPVFVRIFCELLEAWSRRSPAESMRRIFAGSSCSVRTHAGRAGSAAVGSGSKYCAAAEAVRRKKSGSIRSMARPSVEINRCVTAGNSVLPASL